MFAGHALDVTREDPAAAAGVTWVSAAVGVGVYKNDYHEAEVRTYIRCVRRVKTVITAWRKSRWPLAVALGKPQDPEIRMARAHHSVVCIL